MNKNILKSIVAINAVIFILVIMSCDLFEDFEDETSKMEYIDDLAADIFSDTLLINIVPATIEKYYKIDSTLTGVDTTTLYILKFAESIDTLTDKLPASILTFLYEDSARISTSNNVVRVISSSTYYNTYYCYDFGSSGRTVFYFDDYVNMQLYSESGNVLTPYESMPLEIVAGYFKVQNKTPVPIIKSRYEYSLHAGKYLIEIITTDQTISRTFNAVILSD